MAHAASVAAELLDNDEDGIVDDPLIEAQLRDAMAVMPIFVEDDEDSPAMKEFEKAREGSSSAYLFEFEMDPDWTGSVNGNHRDATLEEILHTIKLIVLTTLAMLKFTPRRLK